MQVLKEIEDVAPSKDHYSNLCLLLTMNKLSDHPDYKSWNPSKGRHKCFKDILPLVEDLLSGGERGRPHPQTNNGDENSTDELVATNDRLLQLIIKGILYESCVDFCQQKATGIFHLIYSCYMIMQKTDFLFLFGSFVFTLFHSNGFCFIRIEFVSFKMDFVSFKFFLLQEPNTLIISSLLIY